MDRDALNETYYVGLAAAYLRGLANESTNQSPEGLVSEAHNNGTRLQRFKRSAPLPRVRRVLGFFQAIRPRTVLDVGTGRGAFLWPLLDAFPELRIHCVDLLEHRVDMIMAVHRGGYPNLTAEVGDIGKRALEDLSFEVVTALEVLEHMTDPQRAIASLIRGASRYVVASVPSKADDNPEHVHLFAPGALEERFLEAGATRVASSHVPNHRIVFATV